MTDGFAKQENDRRADRARHALENYLAVAGEALPDEHTDDGEYTAYIGDMISDLFHLADQLDLEPEYIVSAARDHYFAEVDEALAEEVAK